MPNASTCLQVGVGSRHGGGAGIAAGDLTANGGGTGEAGVLILVVTVGGPRTPVPEGGGSISQVVSPFSQSELDSIGALPLP
mmetsp:Transcript_50178/g.98796  ORF Transcript_50178/g.98796 Transcript_50178/m.98796 type:complete len:82 (+) Transcript_50178:91-336(+)